MSLYEALDQFVGAGVLACGGVVGADFPATMPLDGAAFSRFLREQRLGEEFGVVLDALAHEIWLAQDQRGFPQRVCEAHAAALAVLLSEIRLNPADLLPAIEQARRAASGQAASAMPAAREQITSAWLVRAKAGDHLTRGSLIEDVARFLLEALFQHIIEQPRLMTSLKPTLTDYLDRRTGSSQAQRALPPPAPAPAQPLVPARTLAMAPKASVPRPATTDAAPLASSPAVAEIRARHGLQDGAVKRLQTILATQAMTGEQRLARLDELGAWLTSTIAQLQRPTNDVPELRRLKTEAASALTVGDLERAMDLLREVRSHLREDRRRSEARLAEEMDTLKANMIAEAEAAGRLGELALARCEFEAAADLFAEAAGNLPTRESALEFDYRQRQAEALAARAETTGDARTLTAAATAFRAAANLLDKAANPQAWARVHVGLGDMLMALGVRNSAAATELELAATAFESAIEVIDRAAHPMRWALVQLSRSVALIELGNRTDRDIHWMSAAKGLMAALEVFESRNATDLADAARAKLRTMHSALAAPAVAKAG